MTSRDKWLAYGLAALGALLLASPAHAPGPVKPGAPKPRPTPGKTPTPPARKDGDVISYFFDPTLGVIIVKTHESPDVEWGAPQLKADKVPAFQAMASRWGNLIDDVGIEFQIPSNELKAIMWSESGGDPNAKSNRGALGLLQVMPFNFPSGLSEAQMKDPRTNMRAGAKLLAAAKRKGQDLIQMASWYNAGGKDGIPYTNASYVAACTTDKCRKDRSALMTRWGYPAQPAYIDTVVAAFNTAQTLERSS